MMVVFFFESCEPNLTQSGQNGMELHGKFEMNILGILWQVIDPKLNWIPLLYESKLWMEQKLAHDDICAEVSCNVI